MTPLSKISCLEWQNLMLRLIDTMSDDEDEIDEDLRQGTRENLPLRLCS
jgi:hypothetical protein